MLKLKFKLRIIYKDDEKKEKNKTRYFKYIEFMLIFKDS